MSTQPALHNDVRTAPASPQQTVEAFLDALQELDFDKLMSLCAPNIRWVNAPITTSTNKEQFGKACRAMFRRVTHFGVEYRDIHERGDGVVYTDRIDSIEGGGLTMKIDVQGEFVVKDGLVVSWVDRFSWPKALGDIARSLPAIVAFHARR